MTTKNDTKASDGSRSIDGLVSGTIGWGIGQKLHLLRGKEVPMWLHSFAGYVTKIGRKRFKVRIPVDDDKERWVSPTQLQLNDPWAR